MKRILIVEDERDIQELLEAYLGDAGYETATAGDGIEAVSLFQQEAFDLVLLDVMLPKLDGFGVCELIRRQSRVPIVLLTALDGEAEQLRGFDLEIDDYITKPFLPQELLLRLAAVLRRVYGAGAGEVLRLGAAEVHWGTGTVRRPGGGEAALTAKEYALLKKLAANRGNIVTIDALCQALWEGPMVGYENTLMVHIRRLREKLETDPSHPQYLLTVRGLGYRLAREERS